MSTKPTPINWTKQEVQKFASDAANKLGYQAGGDIEKIVRHLGGTVRRTDWDSVLQTGSLEVIEERNFLINLSPYSGERRARFTMAHELGHYMLHSNLGKHPITIQRDGENNRVEWEANWFAAGFLMPEAEFKRLAARGWSDAEIGEHFDVSEAAVEIRRKALGC
ncbi:ImmA/IrrE family metallo-endopeptidase [Verrucomicrobium sp. BvORR034]|uniref:ImmA/IrrE family metallo-endopeptidase n=1 Tax=Verrucomicrobium sp. BvORR034 TaxID=1396418 RepID=UPI0006791FD2|nr:ImmA/IrrE family metallo-endopeptidase [Verrucomicrobium sp. BvORR034]